jgi:hypothetical protein
LPGIGILKEPVYRSATDFADDDIAANDRGKEEKERKAFHEKGVKKPPESKSFPEAESVWQIKN